nr:MAG TPA: hypothetical protein [Bacteriophage sp.]
MLVPFFCGEEGVLVSRWKIRPHPQPLSEWRGE